MDLPVLEFRTVEELKELDEDGELVRELVGLFLVDSNESLRVMRAALAAQELDRLGRQAHKLKSGAANLGAVRVAEICRTIEEAARRALAGSYAQWLDSLEQEIMQAQNALSEIP